VSDLHTAMICVSTVLAALLLSRKRGPYIEVYVRKFYRARGGGATINECCHNREPHR
jgi:hypothetical protein